MSLSEQCKDNYHQNGKKQYNQLTDTAFSVVEVKKPCQKDNILL